MRHVLIILAGSALLLSGCATHHRCCDDGRAPQAAIDAPCPAIQGVAVLPSARPMARGLIFDRQSGLYTASDFVGRSEWPSTDSYYRAPEIVFYREHFHDRQGSGFNNNDYTYRQFDTYRYGAAVR